MHDFTDWDRLDVAAYRVSIKRSVRHIAWYASLVGAILVAGGLQAGLVPMAAAGVLLLAAGAWNLCRTSITGLVVEGVVLILLGASLGLGWLWLQELQTSSPAKWIVAGLVKIFWGIRRLASYWTARDAVNDPKAIAHLEALVREISRLDVVADPTVAEFRTGRFHRQRNRLGLYDIGVIALLEKQVVRLEKRADIWIEARGTTGPGQSVKVAVRMGDLELPGVMTAEHLERFENWKRGLSRPRAIAA